MSVYKSIDSKGPVGCLIFMVVLAIAAFGGWLTHIFRCIETQEWFLLIAGAILAPIAVIHGWGIWLGVW